MILSRGRAPAWAGLLAAAALGAGAAGLSFVAACRLSPAFDETLHVAAGYSQLWRGDFRLNITHPPLLSLWAAWPLRALRLWPEAEAGADEALNHAWGRALEDPDAEWLFAHQFLYALRPETLRRFGVKRASAVPTTAKLGREDFIADADTLLFWGRLPMALLGGMLVLLVFAWARELYGDAGGLLAAWLCAFDPNLLAHAPLINTDVGLTVFSFGAVYLLWQSCRRLDLARAGLCALFFALAFASKFSSLLLLPTFGLLGLWRALKGGAWPSRPDQRLLSPRRKAMAMAALLALCGLSAWLGLWACYGFRYRAASPSAPDVAPLAITAGARATHRLAPEAYIRGLAQARLKNSRRSSFLAGRRSEEGFLLYFPVAFLVKTPLPHLAAIAAAFFLLLKRRGPELPFLLAPVAVYGLAALGSSLNIGHRHILPIYPYLYVGCGVLAQAWMGWRSRARGLAAGLALGAVAVSSLFVFAPPWRPTPVYPHFLAYFNELAGGPGKGYRLLVDSNLDWGQGLKELRRWLDARGVSEPVNLAYFGTGDPRYEGIPHVNLRGGYPFEPQVDLSRARLPGLLALSATHRQGVYYDEALRLAWEGFLKQADWVATVGHSIFIYRLAAPSGDGAALRR